jgi:hypothetical protein
VEAPAPREVHSLHVLEEHLTGGRRESLSGLRTSSPTVTLQQQDSGISSLSNKPPAPPGFLLQPSYTGPSISPARHNSAPASFSGIQGVDVFGSPFHASPRRSEVTNALELSAGAPVFVPLQSSSPPSTFRPAPLGLDPFLLSTSNGWHDEAFTNDIQPSTWTPASSSHFQPAGFNSLAIGSNDTLGSASLNGPDSRIAPEGLFSGFARSSLSEPFGSGLGGLSDDFSLSEFGMPAFLGGLGGSSGTSMSRILHSLEQQDNSEEHSGSGRFDKR